MTRNSMMEVGVFDHLDLGDRPHEQFYRERLEIVLRHP